MQPTFEAPPPVYPCAWHPDRPTRIGCQRCGRPICPECMNPAPVGFQCPACAAAGRAATPTIRAVQRGPWSAPVTLVLIGVNVLVWLAVLAGGGEWGPLVSLLALSPSAICGIDGAAYLGVGQAQCLASGGVFYPGLMDGAWWQLLTSAFLHIQVFHIGLNMLALWFLGSQLERFLGPARYLALYLVSALAASVAVYWLSDPRSTTLGASGAVFGLMGALFILVWRRGGNVQNILIWLGINVAFTFTAGAGVSWQGHLGGLVGGALIGLLLVGPRQASGRRLNPWIGLAVFVVVLLALTALRTLLLV